MADSSYAAVANDLKTLLDTVFAPEGIEAIHDNLHAALGEASPVLGIAPMRDTPKPGQEVTEEHWVEVKFFDRWKKEITPATVIDPRIIAAKADRFKNAVRENNNPGTGQVWFYKITNVDYPNDPTGNKSRFIATVLAYGNNVALIETTG